jgi:anti-sigma-K factor RskA
VTTDLHHLAAAYALDALDDDERRAFEAHYPTCEICTADVAAHRETVAQLAAAVAATPPPELRDRVMAEIGRTRQLSPLPNGARVAGGNWSAAASRWRRWSGPAVLAVAAALVVAVFGWGAIRTLDGGDSTGDDLQALLEAPGTVISPLAGEGEGTLNLVWHADMDRGVLVGAELAAPGEGSVYELWQIDLDGPRPAGLFQPDDAGRVATGLDLEAEPGATWAVTIEPAGGSPQPTGSILFSSVTA